MIRLKKLKSVRRRQSSLREQLWLQGRVFDGVMPAQDPSDDRLEPSAEIPRATEPTP